jgi:hypothetical protein
MTLTEQEVRRKTPIAVSELIKLDLKDPKNVNH